MTSPNPPPQDIFRTRFFEEPLVPTGVDLTPNHAFWRKQLPARPIEPIETQDHDEAGGR